MNRQTYSFSIRPDLMKQLNDEIGYGSRSEVIEGLIEKFLARKGGKK